jgi:c-di-GMP-related signal transduction protein
MSLYEILSTHPDSYAVARLIEPHLLLLKSRTLCQLYDALRYQKDYREITERLTQDAVLDYRLTKFLEELLIKLKV